MTAVWVIWTVMGLALVAYTLTAGADFGAGVWDLLAPKDRAERHREAIAHAIAPIWEANHVWVIFLIVMMFTVFPRAFSVIGTALHIPITLALVGIVLRGAAFTFRAYGLNPNEAARRWGRVFAWSSTVTPLFLGATLAALMTGDIRVDEAGHVASGFFAGWTSPMAVATGVFTLVLFAMMAAVYLAADTDGELRDDFSKRGLIAQVVVICVGGVVLAASYWGAPRLWETLVTSRAALVLHGLAFCAAAVCAWSLFNREPGAARIAVVVEVTAIVVGWGVALDGALVVPDVTVDNAGTRPEMMGTLLWVLGLGSLLLIPSMWYLMVLFKGQRAQRDQPE